MRSLNLGKISSICDFNPRSLFRKKENIGLRILYSTVDNQMFAFPRIIVSNIRYASELSKSLCF